MNWEEFKYQYSEELVEEKEKIFHGNPHPYRKIKHSKNVQPKKQNKKKTHFKQLRAKTGRIIKQSKK